MGKKRREKERDGVPEVLWRLFGDRARTLSAVLDAPSSILRRGDPSPYRSLLTRCFVVIVSDQSPTMPRLSNESYFPQSETVARTIEMIIYEQSASSNVLCSGYDKYKQSSPLLEILSSPEWCLLLERVGEEVMYFLLRHTSIFIPHNGTNYHQVAGPPITELCFKQYRDTFETRISSSRSIGTKNKRDGEDDAVPFTKRRQQTSSFEIGGTASTVTPICSSKVGDSLRSLSCDLENDKYSQTLDVATPITKQAVLNPENNTSQEAQQNTEQGEKKVRKRSRPFLRQRRKLRKQRELQETAVENSCQRTLVHEARLPENCNLEDNEPLCEEEHTCPERKVPRHADKQAEVNRQSLFYNLEVSSSALPRKHILNSLKPNMAGAMSLLKSIFGIYAEMASPDAALCSRSEPNSDSLCLYHSMIKHLKKLISRAQHRQHSRLLNKHCGVQSKDQKAVCELEIQKENNARKRKHVEGNDCEDIKSYCHNSQVVSYVWAACRSIVPSEMLGTPKNWRRLTSNIHKFVQLRRFEKFSLKQCVHKLKTSEMPFFTKKQSLCCLSNQVSGLQCEFTKLNEASHIMKQRIVESWIYWLFSHLVVPLLQASFYVTESEHGRQEIFYYTKSVWGEVKKKAIDTLKDKNYAKLDDATTRTVVKRRRFGFSKLRLLPKEKGLRLLANLKAPSRMPKLDFFLQNEPPGSHGRRQWVKQRGEFYHFKPVNSVLKEVHAVLKGMQFQEPDKLGSSVFDYNDVYRKLCSFLTSLKSSSPAMPAVFLIASDVLKAFDTVDQNKLLTVINDILKQDRYTLKQFSEVCCAGNSIWVREKHALLDQNINSRVTPLISCRSPDSILVNQECKKLVMKQDILFNLNEHVKRNVLQLDKRFYLQRVGICQGSILSSLLCSLYYGDMDNKVIFPFLERVNQHLLKNNTSNGDSQNAVTDCRVTPNSYMLLRFIDDFLFISNSKDQAEALFSRLSRGFRDYNCYMNKDKYSVNFDISHVSEKPSNRICVGKDGVSFIRWSGLLINCSTLEVQADYTKYLNIHLRSSLTVTWHDKLNRRFEEKLCRFLRPKCHPLFYDSNINSASVVRLNIFQSFLICAMKFHCYLRDLSYICKLRSGSCMRMIESSFRYMHFMIKKRMSSPSLGPVVNPILQLEDGEVEWLGLNAYIQVLNRKQSRHKKLLSSLKHKLWFHKLSSKKSSELEYAVDMSHSDLVWKIKY